MQKSIQFLMVILILLFISRPSLAVVNEVKAADLDQASISLLVAAQNGNVDKVEQLIADKVPADVKDDYGRTPLHIASEFGQKEVAVKLIDAGPKDKNERPDQVIDEVQYNLVKFYDILKDISLKNHVLFFVIRYFD